MTSNKQMGKIFLTWLFLWFGAGFLLRFLFTHNIVAGCIAVFVLTGLLVGYWIRKTFGKAEGISHE